VAFWERALTADEVLVLYGIGLQGISFLTPPGPRPTLSYSVASGELTLTWTGDGFTLQESAQLGTAAVWSTVAGSTANSATVPTSSSTRFYRLTN
jgi:hypothetical protein